MAAQVSKFNDEPGETTEGPLWLSGPIRPLTEVPIDEASGIGGTIALGKAIQREFASMRKRRSHEIILAGKLPIKSPLRHVCMDRDVIHRDPVKAVTQEQRAGGMEDASPGIKPRPSHAARPRHRDTTY